jgi:hypothetical protein
VYDRAVAAFQATKAKGFRFTINCTFFNDTDPERAAAFFDTVTKLLGSTASLFRPATLTSGPPTRRTF